MIAAILALAAALPAQTEPIRLHPENPHYFLFRGKPTFLITSGEHYGAVLNLDFDHAPYLDELARHGLNLTRTFSGTYREVPGSFNIRDNTLAPRPGRYQAPWARDGEKYDLDRLDPAYFERLKSFVAEAGRRGIVVEYVLFCPFYEPVLWDVDPMNAKNNVNGVGDCPREEVYTLKHPELLKRQLAFVERAVRELNGFDNVYFEICNEPYAGVVTAEWQARVAEAIVAAEKDLPNKHLIAQNIANDKAKIEDPDPAVSIFNFHYATPPVTVGMNYALNKPIADDETGFRGTGDLAYRVEAWEFLLAGGAVVSNLDYSFTPDHEDGSAKVEDPTPGGGGRAFREQLGVLKRFLEGFAFTRMRPDPEVVGQVPSGVTAHALGEPGRQYAIYLRGEGGGKEIRLKLPAGSYKAEWVDTRSGDVLDRSQIDLAGSGNAADPKQAYTLKAPEFREDVALRVVSLREPDRAARPLPRLKVSDNHRFLVTEDGRPFFYLGDTAWELFHRLDRDEAELYLKDRASKGFNVIQAVVLAELDGLHVPNANGDRPLIDDDPTRPNEAYFKHVDDVVGLAEANGLYVGMLPTWGDKVNKKWGVGPEVFTPENARAYGEFLGRRYKDRAILWILGGDRPIDDDRHRAVYAAMAEGLRAGDEGRHLITFHPSGGSSSSQWFHDADWLDFNMLQSGHASRDATNDGMIARDYARTPAKPCLDGEPRYEDHPIDWKPQNGWFDEHDVRKAAYWGVFAGACGTTYGCHDIWQMWRPGRDPISSARTPWREALKLPASSQMRHLRNLVESRPYLERIPDQSLVVGDPGRGGDHVQATRGSDGSYAFLYLPSGKPVTVDLAKLSGDRLTARWYDPRTGEASPAMIFPRQGTQRFEPPAGGQDWVLVLDDAARQYPTP